VNHANLVEEPDLFYFRKELRGQGGDRGDRIFDPEASGMPNKQPDTGPATRPDESKKTTMYC